MIHKFLLIAVSILLASPTALSQERLEVKLQQDRGVINDVEESKVALHPVTPYMESSSAMLIDIDLTKVDVDAMLAWVKDAFELEAIPANAQAVGFAVNGFLVTLDNAGADHIYIGASTRSIFDRGPIVVIPCQDTATVNGLAAMAVQNAPPEYKLKSHIGDGLVLLGPAATVDRVVESEGISRPDLILPTKADDRLDHSLVISLPLEARQDLEALWPDKLPSEVPVQFSPRQLAKDVRRFVISWRLPPEPEVDVRVECREVRAALRVSKIIDQAIALSADLNGLVQVQIDEAAVSVKAEPRVFAELLEIVSGPSRRQARQVQKMNNMKMLGLAIHNYHAVEKNLPPRCRVDGDGKPLLSWRVVLLPHLEQRALYQSFKLDQPFDSEANQVMAQMQIPLFANESAEPTQTTFRAGVSGLDVGRRGPPKSIRDVVDGTSNTIALIDAPPADAIAWADPQPWVIDSDDPMSDIFGDRESVTVLMLDGSVRVFTREELADGKLPALLTIAGGEVIQW